MGRGVSANSHVGARPKPDILQDRNRPTQLPQIVIQTEIWLIWPEYGPQVGMRPIYRERVSTMYTRAPLLSA